MTEKGLDHYLPKWLLDSVTNRNCKCNKGFQLNSLSAAGVRYLDGPNDQKYFPYVVHTCSICDHQTTITFLDHPGHLIDLSYAVIETVQAKRKLAYALQIRQSEIEILSQMINEEDELERRTHQKQISLSKGIHKPGRAGEPKRKISKRKPATDLSNVKPKNRKDKNQNKHKHKT